MKKVIITMCMIIIGANMALADGSNNWSRVTASGLSYAVNVTSPQSAIHGQPFQVLAQVQSSGFEYLKISIGYVQNGVQYTVCERSTAGPVADTGSISCYFKLSQPGSAHIFVGVEDPNFPTYQPFLACTNSSTQGCMGTYSININ